MMGGDGGLGGLLGMLGGGGGMDGGDDMEQMMKYQPAWLYCISEAAWCVTG